MKTAGSFRRDVGRPTADSGDHLLSIGQSVTLKSAATKTTRRGQVYRITGTLPPSGGAPQYRIRNSEEHHERVAMQDELEPVKSTGGDAHTSLMERTFGNGQGTKA